jgi:hypothetical protein
MWCLWILEEVALFTPEALNLHQVQAMFDAEIRSRLEYAQFIEALTQRLAIIQAEKSARVLELETKLSTIPDLALLEQAQVLLGSINAPVPQEQSKVFRADYLDLMKNILRNLQIQDQDQLLSYLPSLQDLKVNPTLHSLVNVVYFYFYFGSVVPKWLLQDVGRGNTKQQVRTNLNNWVANSTNILRYLFQAQAQWEVERDVTNLVRSFWVDKSGNAKLLYH